MPLFKISAVSFEASPVFDLHTSGKDLTAIEISTVKGLYGDKQVFVFETKLDSELCLTLKKIRGDIEIDLAPNWDVDVDVISFNDFGVRLPRVTVVQGDRQALMGYVASGHIKVHFFKPHQTLQGKFVE